MFSGYTTVRSPTLAIKIDCASIKDFTYTSLGKLFIYIFVFCLCYVICLYYCLYHLEGELKL
jgi:hypothetical protein